MKFLLISGLILLGSPRSWSQNVDFKALKSCFEKTQFKSSAHDQFKKFDLSTQMPLNQLIHESLGARLRFIDGFVLTNKFKSNPNNILAGLVNNGPCMKAICPTPVEIKTLASRIICQVNPKHNECVQGDLDGTGLSPDMMGRPTNQF